MEKFRIMIVEDDEDTQEILSAYLEPEYEVCTANNGVDALTKLDYVEPDLIISDVMMPIMDGRTFVSALRKRPDCQNMPVIFLSALTGREDIVEGYDAGANLYLTKPIEPARLTRNVEQILRDRAGHPRPKRMPMEEYKKWLQGRLAAKPPTAPEAAGQTEKVKPLTKISMKNVRVLIVDDDPDVLKILSLPLINECEIVTATDGLSALDKAVRYKPDIFIIDWMMPRMTGYQLCQMLKRSAEFRDAPIIFVSAKTSPKDQELVKRLGVYRFLPKPFKLNDVLRMLEEIIRLPGFTIRQNRVPYEEVMKDEQIQRDVSWRG
ncbi:MAG: hypothetical protein Kow0059_11020 [Candidatus Sumerlaeia bacterium]